METGKNKKENFFNFSDILSEFAPISILITDIEGAIIQVNESARRFLGYAKGELVGHSLTDICDKITFENWKEFRERLSPDKELTLESEIKDKSGRGHRVEITLNGFKIDGHTVISCYMRDLSKMQATEEILRLIHCSVDRASESIYWLKSDSSLFYVNDSACRELGYSREELLGRKITEIDPEFPMDRWPEHWAQMRTLKSKVIESKHRTKTGQVVPVQLSINYLKLGEDEYHCTFARDISHRKQIENRLRQENTFRNAIISKGGDGICVCHNIPDFPYVAFTVWNDRMREITGYSMQEINEHGWYQSLYPDPDVREQAIARMSRMRDGDDLEAEEWVIRRADGDNRTILISTSILETGNHETHVVAMMLDITERKKAEIALRDALKEVEQLKNRLQAENIYLREELKYEHNYDNIIGESPVLKEVLEKIEQVARTDASVLITGETGTGKELIARAVHQRSLRADRPMIKVNCASIPKDLFESEFFGHIRGAFTGAHRDRIGRFQLANGGILFLDEVGEIPFELQSKLLRVLQEGQFERIGEDITQTVNVRIIASTNRHLEEEVVNQNFRQDLYFRLSVFPIEVPPLRDRLDDIPVLARHFIKISCRRIGISEIRLSESHIRQLREYSWPGNVRELQNVIERAVIKSRSGMFDLDLPAEMMESIRLTKPSHDKLILKSGRKIINQAELRQIEIDNIKAALDASNWKVYGSGGAAERLGMKPSTLASRIKALNIKKT